jgi:PadR family transcriptional regulator, regulatory protein PadR
MPTSKQELLQGTLDLQILKTLEPGPNHGLGISRRIQQVTRGTFEVKPGSLFPALHRPESPCLGTPGSFLLSGSQGP